MKLLWLDWDDGYTPRRVREACRQLGIDGTFAQIDDLLFSAGGEPTGAVLDGCDIAAEYDVLVARAFHPRISEILTVARLFKEAGKRVIDASLTDEGFAVSKMHDYLILNARGLPVPKTWQAFTPEATEQIAAALGFPVVLKGVHGSYGSHVHLARDVAELRAHQSAYERGELMVQEYLPAPGDFRVLTVGYRALPALVERTPPPGDFRTNAALGSRLAARPTAAYPDLAALAEQSARALRREFAAVDMRFKGSAPLVLEVNRRPAFRNYELATGADVAGRFLRYVAERVSGANEAPLALAVDDA